MGDHDQSPEASFEAASLEAASFEAASFEAASFDPSRPGWSHEGLENGSIQRVFTVCVDSGNENHRFSSNTDNDNARKYRTCAITLNGRARFIVFYECLEFM